MKKLILLFIGCVILTSSAFAQITYNPTVRSKNNPCTIEKVELTKEEMIVTLKIPTRAYKSFSISDGTVWFPSNPEFLDYFRSLHLDWKYCLNLSIVNVNTYREALRTVRENREQWKALLIKRLGNGMELGTSYKLNRNYDYNTVKLYFPPVKRGIDDISIREVTISDGAWEWIGIKINNPYPNVEYIVLTELEMKSLIDKSNDPLCGIYEIVDSDNLKLKLKLACIKHNNTYKLLFIYQAKDPVDGSQPWKIGEVRAILYPTATYGLFKADYYDSMKELSERYVSFGDGMMKITNDGETEEFLKLYPITTSSTNGNSITKWSGTGFAIGSNCIVTNHHVIDGAKAIKIKGVKGNFEVQYQAEVIASDRNNDLALLKITDSHFAGFANIPYAAKTALSDVGEDIFVLGYPLTSTMGEEIKLTTGVISSRSGFQGDIASYQISAPVQPGNSGGPLFDSKGNLIGVVSAKHTQAENAGYAVKTSYLKILIENAVGNITLPNNNQISNLPLTEKIKKVDDYIVLIECSK